MAGGAVTQVMNTGVEDGHLNATPEVTFFEIEYRQYANFAIESIENIFNGQTDFGKKCTANAGRAGDALGPLFAQVTLPEINQEMGVYSSAEQSYTLYARWLDCPGEQIIAEYEIEIGNQRVDKKYGDFVHIWNNLTLPANKIKGYYYLIGHTPQLTYLIDPRFAPIAQPCDASKVAGQVCTPRKALPETTLYIPLLFWFTNNPGLALPMIALQFHEVRIHITFRPIGEVLWAVTALNATAGTNSLMARAAMQQSIVSCSLFGDYYFLEADERRKMVQNPHDYLITQLQFNGELAIGSSIVRSIMNWSHPNSEMIFVVQPDYNVDFCGSFTPGTPLFNTLGVQTFNYTDAIDSLPNAMHAFAAVETMATNYGFINPQGLFQQAGGVAIKNPASGSILYNAGNGAASAPVPSYTNATYTGTNDTYGPFGSNNYIPKSGTGAAAVLERNDGDDTPVITSGLSDAAAYVIGEVAFDLHCWGENPVVTCRLQLNSQERFQEREGSYFDGLQVYQFHSRTADRGINVYSFAFNPEGYQPSGACNFSRMDNATLHLVLSAAAITGVNTAKLRIYGIAYNFIKINGGMIGINYA